MNDETENRYTRLFTEDAVLVRRRGTRCNESNDQRPNYLEQLTYDETTELADGSKVRITSGSMVAYTDENVLQIVSWERAVWHDDPAAPIHLGTADMYSVQNMSVPRTTDSD